MLATVEARGKSCVSIYGSVAIRQPSPPNVVGRGIAYRLIPCFHIVLKDPEQPHRMMIVEVVDPTRPGAKTSTHSWTHSKEARRQFVENLRRDGSLDDLIGQRVCVRGLGFFDFSHRQNGKSRTCLELHRVLTITAARERCAMRPPT